MPSVAARDCWKLKAIGCQGASWSEQLDGKGLRGEDYFRFWAMSYWLVHPSSTTTMCYDDFNWYCNPCTDLGSTLLPHMTLYPFRNPCVASFGHKAGGVLFGEGLHSRQVFDWG